LKWILWISFGISALSLDFIWGKAGIFCFGQNALFGIGAYAYAVVAINFYPITMETGTALIAAGVVAALFAAMLGYIMFYGRVGDVYLAIVTLAVTLTLFTIMSSTAGPNYRIGQALLGGFNGIPSVPTMAIGIPGDENTSPLSPSALLGFSICLAALIYIFLRFLSSGKFGNILAGVRENEVRMELLGYDTRKYKLAAFTLGGAVAGLGGALYTAWGMFVNPSVFALAQAALIVIWVIVGGRGTLGGAFLGVIVVQWISDEADHLVNEQTPLILGILLILMVLLVPGGIASLLGKVSARILRRLPGFAPQKSDEFVRKLKNGHPGDAHLGDTEAPPHAAGTSEVVGRMSVKDVTKNFGGLSILRGVTLDFSGPGVYAIIGANGAGKTTLFGVLTGYHVASSGAVSLNGRNVVKLAPYLRARMGLGIKMQVPSLCAELSVRENLELALYKSASEGLPTSVITALQAGGLVERMDSIVSTLPHGEKQWLEIAMVLAQGPSVILLDEPAAGMTKAERASMLGLIENLSRNYTIVVVEHDMSFIRALNSPVAMLHRGKVFRHGTFDEVCSDPEVIDAYLGRNHVANG
jgi:branched-chain amino acid transport system permease protein